MQALGQHGQRGLAREQQGRIDIGAQRRRQQHLACQRLGATGQPGPRDVLGGFARRPLAGPAHGLLPFEQACAQGRRGVAHGLHLLRQRASAERQRQARHGQAPRLHVSPGAAARVRSQACASGTTRSTRLA